MELLIKNALVIGCCSEKGFDLTQRWTNKKWKSFFRERTFWRNVLERLIDIVIFLAEKNLAFRESDEVAYWALLTMETF